MPFCRLASALIRPGINRKGLAADQTFSYATLENRHKDTPRQVALRKRPCGFFEKVECSGT
jgi:hypothetical protein